MKQITTCFNTSIPTRCIQARLPLMYKGTAQGIREQNWTSMNLEERYYFTVHAVFSWYKVV